MAYDGQIVNGFFKRFRRGVALCKIPFYDILIKMINIFETIEGINGIKIIKPQHDGTGWKITIDLSGGEIVSGFYPRAFDISIDGSTATLSNLYFVNKGVIAVYQSGTLSTTLDDASETYVGVRISFNSGTVSILDGTTLGSVSESATPSLGQETLDYPLYVISKTDGVYSVAVDLRSMPTFPAYL